jgi:UDP-glucose 4-epimerase
VLITGGAGFLGSNLAKRLCERFEVVLFDNFRRNALGFTDLAEHKNVKLIQASILDRKALLKALADCDWVVHFASVAGVNDVAQDPVMTMRTALIGTDNLLQACRNNKRIKKVLIASTSEVYGQNADSVSEHASAVSFEVGSLRSSYAVSKYAAEVLAFCNYRQYQTPICLIRPFNVYGPLQVGEGAIQVFIRRALGGLPLMVHNGGAQVRAWCYVDDALDGIQAALFSDQAIGEVFNLGNPQEPVSVRKLAEMVISATGSDSRLEELVCDNADINYRVPDISHANKLLGFFPKVDLSVGLELTAKWFGQHYRAKSEGIDESTKKFG